ncbi:type VII secretion integral membrane protein EccD [Streptomyces spiramenti]|uniref:Type VII secretion integral membrane protein EccD n=1 Tax=Streptomyces spiramenti TaxID=2720606 RepID=A0ABX1ATJ8_9ACTN|nr:type VII secretion integral membrane protein EccD [Streptomyces spiramenti]NJP68931.1 type VII secretion integral membrane protein EccD [Streptomyces spiramenti]
MSVEAWGYTSVDRRVTVIGAHRRADLSLSAEVPVGLMLPEVLRVLGEQPGDHPTARRLVTAAGREIPLGASLSFAAVLDGAVLRLVREEELPAAPVVHDVADTTADDLAHRDLSWGPTARAWTAGAAIAALSLAASHLAVVTHGTTTAAPWIGVALLLTTAVAVAALLTDRRDAGVAAAVSSGTLGVLLAAHLAAHHQWQTPLALAALLTPPVVVLVLLGLLTPLRRGAHIGAAALAATGGLWLAVGAFTGFDTAADRARLGAVAAVAAVFALGVLPRLAITAAGLTGLDDRHAGGRPAARSEVGRALDASHHGLAAASVVTAGSGAAGAALALGEWSPWSAALAVLVAVVLLSRARLFPMAVSVIALVAAGTAVLVRLVLGWSASLADQPWPALVLAGLGVAALALLAARPAEHTRVRGRRLAGMAESLAVVAVLPVAVGVFGVYGRLLDTF